MKFALSYSGGKDCMLALHRMVSLGNTPVALITTINGEEERSWFHGIPKTLLEAVSSSLNIPLIACKSQPEQYAEAFVEGLIKAKSLGAEACVFGDIDIADHRKWNEEIAEKAGLGCVLPLWQEEREALVYELISTGYKAIIKIVQSDKLSESFLGQDLSLPLLEDIKATGSDVCGENGEYHSFVYDGPLFCESVKIACSDPIDLGTHKAVDLFVSS